MRQYSDLRKPDGCTVSRFSSRKGVLRDEHVGDLRSRSVVSIYLGLSSHKGSLTTICPDVECLLARARYLLPYHCSPSSVVWPSCPSSATSPVSSYRVRRSGSDNTEWTKDSAWKRPFASSSPGHLSGCCIRVTNTQQQSTQVRELPQSGGAAMSHSLRGTWLEA